MAVNQIHVLRVVMMLAVASISAVVAIPLPSNRVHGIDPTLSTGTGGHMSMRRMMILLAPRSILLTDPTELQP